MVNCEDKIVYLSLWKLLRDFFYEFGIGKPIMWIVPDGRSIYLAHIELHRQTIVNTWNVNVNPFFYYIIKQTIADEFITRKNKHTQIMIIAQLRTSSIDLFKRERRTFAQNQKFTYSSVLHSDTVLMKLCPCGRYRQLNSVLYRNNHVLKSSKIIFNRLIFKQF